MARIRKDNVMPNTDGSLMVGESWESKCKCGNAWYCKCNIQWIPNPDYRKGQ